MKVFRNNIIIVIAILVIPGVIFVSRYLSDTTLAKDAVGYVVDAATALTDELFPKDTVIPGSVGSESKKSSGESASAPVDEPATDNSGTDEPATEPATEPETEPYYGMPPEPAEAIPVSFPNTLFIGDSRTVGLMEYGCITDADFFCMKGTTATWVMKQSFNVNGTVLSFDELMDTRSYEVVHIMLGINELGNSNEYYLEKMSELIAVVREKQPDAVILIGANLYVTRDNSYGTDNSAIHGFNDIVKDYKPDDKVFYVDLNDIFSEDGYMCPSITFDGIHCFAEYYPNWAQWLRYKLDRILEEVAENAPAGSGFKIK